MTAKALFSGLEATESKEAIPPQLSGIYILAMSPEDLPGLYRERSNNTFLAIKIAGVEPTGIYFLNTSITKRQSLKKEHCLKIFQLEGSGCLYMLRGALWLTVAVLSNFECLLGVFPF